MLLIPLSLVIDGLALPDPVRQPVDDASAFLAADLPALSAWTFTPDYVGAHVIPQF